MEQNIEKQNTKRRSTFAVLFISTVQKYARTGCASCCAR